ncbi:putative addiction module component [Botrimarina colliarenosi]|uniref:Putative addiction module component n=1 Tax=Botrimarina colliarenosi TaxID=2528001 RepID=A0A5C6ABV1_9BACT|nr:addiction module protein [Botrimarina colliarenosi]TWT96886.1 putative addiction module component [Botrimarina colliarenosi]
MLSDPDEAIDAVMNLPADRRIEIAHRLVRSVVDAEPESDTPLLSDNQVAEIERRLAALKADPSIGLSHEEVWRQLRERHDA